MRCARTTAPISACARRCGTPTGSGASSRSRCAQRRALAGAARTGSQAHTAAVEYAITDVNADSVALALRTSGAATLLHGHTHRPGIHPLSVDGRACTRIVLGDWYTQGSVLRWDSSGPELRSLAAPEWKRNSRIAARDELGLEAREGPDSRSRVDAGARRGALGEIEVHLEMARFGGVQTLEQLADGRADDRPAGRRSARRSAPR